MKNKKEITINDLALMVGKGFADMDKRFEGVDKKFEGIDKKFEGIDKKFEGIDKKLETMASKEDLKKMELDLKDHIDEKLGKLKGDMVSLTKKEDNKLLYLVELLKEEKILNNNKTKKILKMEPFPRLVL